MALTSRIKIRNPAAKAMLVRLITPDFAVDSTFLSSIMVNISAHILAVNGQELILNTLSS